MELNEYQKCAMSTCMPSCDNFGYMFIGFIGEVGELAGKYAKHIRKEEIAISNNHICPLTAAGLTDEQKEALKSELADCQWFIAGLAHVMGWELEDICQSNLDKLASRAKRGVIDGNGDNR